jgi:hypothetical protein
MSIWGSFGGVEPLYKDDYGWDPAGIAPGSSLDLASAISWYGGNAIRVSLDSGDGHIGGEGHTCAVVSREQVGEIVRQLQDWLASTA